MPKLPACSRPLHCLLAAWLGFAFCALWPHGTQAEEPPSDAGRAAAEDDPVHPGRIPQSIAEARARAELLHETIGGTLQVMHRDLFDDEQTFSIPSRSLEDVFAELARSHQVRLRWLIVNADALNVDHQPQTPFEVDAVAALRKGQPSYARAGDSQFQFAGPIELKSQCLKCHLKDRRSNQPRLAGLSITIPWRATAQETAPSNPPSEP